MRLCALSFSCAAALAAVASATPIFVGHIQFAESYGSLGGGEFRAIPQSDFTITPLNTGTAFQFGIASAAPQFETFCMERFENIDTSGATYRADLNTETVAQAPEYAGGAHGGFNDPLDARTAYLYDHFIHHQLLTAYNYSDEASRIEDANSLQQAIWFIEEEDSTPLLGKALDFYNEANSAVNSGQWTGIGDVRILNIYTDGDRVDYQDELVLVPGPASLIALAAGLALRRRRS